MATFDKFGGNLEGGYPPDLEGVQMGLKELGEGPGFRVIHLIRLKRRVT